MGEMIKFIRASGMGNLFNETTSQAQFKTLRFYPDVALYRLTNFATLPAFSLEYLGNGRDFVYLDGSEEPIYRVNQHIKPDITEETISDYLDFYFRHVSTADGETSLADEYGESTTLEKLLHSGAAKLTRDPEGGYYQVMAPVNFAGAMVHGVIRVGDDGRVDIRDNGLLLGSGDPADMNESRGSYLD